MILFRRLVATYNFLLHRLTTRGFLLPLLFLSLFFFFLRPPTDPDLGWHLRYGQMMVEEHQFPQVDTFSSTMPGFAWADSYWLSEVLMYGLYSVGGYYLLSVIFSLIAVVTVLFSFRKFKQKESSLQGDSFWGLWDVRLVLGLFTAVLLIVPFVGTRPQTISLLFFSITLLLLRSHRYYLLLPLFLLWANLHAGFVLGLAIVWLWFADSWLNSYTPDGRGSSRPSGKSMLRTLFHSSVYPFLCTLITLVNPYGLALWRTISVDAGSLEIKQQIAEWQPTVLRSDLGFVYFIFLFAVLIFLGRNFRKERFFDLVALLVFSFLSLASLRHIPLFTVLALPFVFCPPPTTFSRVSKYLYSWLLLTFIGVALMSGVYFLKPLLDGQWAGRDTRGYGDYPAGALAYLKTQPLSGVGLNTYGWGGYLLWNLPGFKSFIDGRMPGWRKPNEPSLFSEYIKAVNLKPGWREVLDKYSVRWVVLEKTVPLAQALTALPGWEKVYEDETAMIITRSRMPSR